MKAVCVVQARLSSTRLPNKVLAPIEGRPMLWHVLHRARMIHGIDQVVLSVPHAEREPLAAVAALLGVETYGGPHPDLLTAYAEVAAYTKAPLVMRITADCPLLDPWLCGLVLRHFEAQWANRFQDCDHGAAHYVANVGPDSDYPDGLDCEVFTGEDLVLAATLATAPYDRHHVTPWIRRERQTYYLRIDDPALAKEAAAYATTGRKWSVDTQADLDHVRDVMARLAPFGYAWDQTLAQAIALGSDQPATPQETV